MKDPLLQYGVLGIVVTGLAWFILYLMKNHKKERDEWKEENKQEKKEANQLHRETNTILTGLKTLLENRK